MGNHELRAGVQYGSFEQGVYAVNSVLSRCYLYGPYGWQDRGPRCSVYDRPRRTIAEIGEKWCASGCENWVLDVEAFYSDGVRRDGQTVRANFGGILSDLSYWGTCCADCNRNGEVDVADLVLLVTIGLDTRLYPLCPLADIDGTTIEVTDMVSGVGEAMVPCVRLEQCRSNPR